MYGRTDRKHALTTYSWLDEFNKFSYVRVSACAGRFYDLQQFTIMVNWKMQKQQDELDVVQEEIST